MAVPTLIPLAYEPYYRTDTLGRYGGGLFFGSAYGHHAYVHLFDRDGAYRQSRIVRVQDRAARGGDGGHVDWVELYPDRLGFHEPWDGLYDT
jgi:hypothetical protein